RNAADAKFVAIRDQAGESKFYRETDEGGGVFVEAEQAHDRGVGFRRRRDRSGRIRGCRRARAGRVNNGVSGETPAGIEWPARSRGYFNADAIGREVQN